MRKIYFLTFGIILLFPIASICFYPFLPGNSMDKLSDVLAPTFSFVFVSSIPCLMGLAFYELNNRNLFNFMNFFAVLTSLFFLSLHLGSLLWNVGVKINIPLPSSIGVGAFIILFISSGIYFSTRKPQLIYPVKINFTFSNGLYKDSLVEIDDKIILFKQSMTGYKRINLSDVEYILEKKLTFWNGSWIRSPSDWDGASRDKIFVMKLKNKRLPIKFTVESSQTVSDIFKTKGLLRQQ